MWQRSTVYSIQGSQKCLNIQGNFIFSLKLVKIRHAFMQATKMFRDFCFPLAEFSGILFCLKFRQNMNFAWSSGLKFRQKKKISMQWFSIYTLYTSMHCACARTEFAFKSTACIAASYGPSPEYLIHPLHACSQIAEYFL